MAALKTAGGALCPPTMGENLLEVRHVSCSPTSGKPIFQRASLVVRDGEVLMLQGKSGCGKTTLLKCLAHLNVYDGEILFRGKTPKSYGIPSYRTHILYVPQRPSLLPGTPRNFLSAIALFGAQKSRSRDSGKLARPVEVAQIWGVEPELWDRKWSDLSGGESQRIALAAAVGMNTAEILLLDEPTSALDEDTALRVEKFLTTEVTSSTATLRALVWITHSLEQGRRVGNRFITVADGRLHEHSETTSEV